MTMVLCTGAILIGGKGSRMRAGGDGGTPKHRVVLGDGRMMLEHVVGNMREVCERIVLVGGDESDRVAGVDFVIADVRAGLGPLGGIEGLLASDLDAGGEYLVCPCDMPGLSADAMRLLLTRSEKLATIVRLENRQEAESLPARIGVGALATVRRLLDGGERAVWRLMKELAAEVVMIPPRWEREFWNVNTPGDLTRH